MGATCATMTYNMELRNAYNRHPKHEKTSSRNARTTMRTATSTAYKRHTSQPYGWANLGKWYYHLV